MESDERLEIVRAQRPCPPSIELATVGGARVLPLWLARPGARSAAHWYERGSDLEDTSALYAIEAYRRALELDPAHAGANVNLGRLLHAAGDVARAEAHYRRAVTASPFDAIAWFNLAVALEDRGRPDEALAAYARALAADSSLIDAHHNAALLCERLGRRTDALRHLSACRRSMRP